MPFSGGYGGSLRSGAVRRGSHAAFFCAALIHAACADAALPENADEQPGRAAHEPVTVQVCGKPVTFDTPPARAVTHDVNITELILSLGLGDRMVGYSGIYAAKAIAPEYREQLAKLPLLSDKGLNLEAIVGSGADFIFAGWGYGFHPGEVTPEMLSQFGIQSYILSESCIRIGARKAVSLEDTFTDLLNLGRIFRVEARAKALVEAQRAELAAIDAALRGSDSRPRVFVYDSGESIPMTTGRFAVTHAMIEAAGGDNIFSDLPDSWTWANWEDVVDRDPEVIVIIDYGEPDAAGKIDFLLAKPELANVAAIRERRFVVLEYAEATPGPRNVARVRTLAQALHPDRFH